MNFDPNFDATIWVSADRRRSIWTAEKQISGSKTRIRTTGRAPVGATDHTLLVIAVIRSLQSITRKQVEYMLSRSEDARQRSKVRIGSTDKTFADALRALMSGDKSKIAATPMRGGRNLHRSLARELARFEITFVTEDDSTFRSLRRWSRQLDLNDEQSVADFQSAFPAFAMGSHDFTAPL